MALAVFLTCGANAQSPGNVSPDGNLQPTTLVDPVPKWNEATGWKVPEGFNPHPPGTAAAAAAKIHEPEGFGLPLLTPREDMGSYDQPLPAGKLVLNAVSSVAVEIANIGGAFNAEGWSIRSGDKILILSATLKEDEKLGIAMPIGNNTRVELVDANGKIVDTVDFPGDRPGLVYHRIPNTTGTWQWVMGQVILGSH